MFIYRQCEDYREITMGIFQKIKETIGFGPSLSADNYEQAYESDYIEIDTKKDIGNKAKIVVKSFLITDFADLKDCLDALREGYTIALVNVKPVKDKDIMELKRVVNKLKKTCDALDGDIAGISEDWLVVTPTFARVDRGQMTEEIQE